MGICIWQRGYVCGCTDRAGGTTCPATPNPEAAVGLHPEPQLAPAQGRLFNFISSAIATPEAVERRRAVLRGCGLIETGPAGMLQTTAAKGGRQQFITSFAVCDCHFGPGERLCFLFIANILNHHRRPHCRSIAQPLPTQQQSIHRVVLNGKTASDLE